MIEVQDLTKSFGDVLAVDRVSFKVEEGEVVGFLGPNGAGKTTTMRILTGFIPATSGRAIVAGHDVAEESLAVRSRVGYLPENVPLYPELRVGEYLAFRARLKGVPWSQRSLRIGEVLDRCALLDVRKRLIGALSKGYRQRVGLADALLADPPILILDEPTVGLDPNQIRLVRDLIRELGRRRTVLLSTHILPEVEMICSRVVIISNGRIALQARVDELTRTRRIVLEVLGDAEVLRAALGTVPGVARFEIAPGARARAVVQLAEGSDPVEAIAHAMLAAGLPVVSMREEGRTLEEAFIRLTMREGEA